MLFSSAKHLTISSHVQPPTPAPLQRRGRISGSTCLPQGCTHQRRAHRSCPNKESVHHAAGAGPTGPPDFMLNIIFSSCCPCFCSLLTPTSLDDTWTRFFCFLFTGDRLSSPKISQPYPSFLSFRLILAIMPISVPRGSLPMLFPYFELPQYAAVHVIIYLLINSEIICIHSTLHFGYLRTD